MSDTPTPRTDAAEERIVNHHGIDAYIVTSHFARQLERELAAERESQFNWKSAALSAALYRADCEVSTPDDYQRHQVEASCALIQRAEQAEARLVEAMSALDAAGCPIGNEHKTYSIVERIAGLHKTRDYAWKQMDEGRARLAEAIAIIRKADFPCTCGGTLSGIHDDEFCPIGTSRKFLSSTETPALLKEVEELRKRIHELQGVPFSDRNYGAMKDKLKIAREVLETTIKDERVPLCVRAELDQFFATIQ